MVSPVAGGLTTGGAGVDLESHAIAARQPRARSSRCTLH
jgi:hypothetical protein